MMMELGANISTGATCLDYLLLQEALSFPLNY